MKVEIELQGTERLLKIYERAGRDPKAKRVMAQAMTGFAQKILNESKKLVPIDTGTLRNSGRVERPKIEPSGVEVEITYGGAASQYAAIVHEDMTMDHSPAKMTAITKKPRRGQAKYLEIPVMANANSFARDVAARYLAYFRRGA